MANCLLLTKTDLATPQEKADLLERLIIINPAASRWQVAHGQIEAEKLLDWGLFSTQEKTLVRERWLREKAYLADTAHNPGHDEQGHTEDHHDHDGHVQDINHHDDRIRAYCFTTDQPISKNIYPTLLDQLFYVGSNILRIKGILNIDGNDHPIALHGVQHILHPLIPLPAWMS